MHPRRRTASLHLLDALHVILLVLLPASHTPAINIVVDYRYDTNGFFDSQLKKDVLQAVADRYSRIITTSLLDVTLTDGQLDPRIGFTHPGTGESWDVSPAAAAESDALAETDEAEEYRGPWALGADDWILYAGGRSMAAAGSGGTGSGLNFPDVFADGASVLNRGFRASGSVSRLPVWGGAVSFDNDPDRLWHFDLETTSPFGYSDFYTVALHEVGHALGLNTGWEDWTQWSSGGMFSGPAAVDAYNADNGTSVAELNEESALNHHWKDGAYDSLIFAAAGPVAPGTVGLDEPQDLLMEPVANYVFPSLRRFELTNVDVAALQDVGWSVLVLGDMDCDGDVDFDDIDDFVLALNDRAGYETMFGVPPKLKGDIDVDGDQDFDDIAPFVDLLNEPAIRGLHDAPEPSGVAIGLPVLVAFACVTWMRRRNRIAADLVPAPGRSLQPRASIAAAGSPVRA